MHESPPTFASSLHADDDAETQAYTGAYSAKSSFDAYVDEDPTSTLPEEVTIVVTTSCVCICRGHGVKQDAVSSADTVAAWPWSSVSSVWGETPDPDPDAMELFVAEVDMIGVYKFQVDYACPIEEALQVNMDACTEAAAKTAEAAANDEFERGCVDQCIEQDTGEIGGVAAKLAEQLGATSVYRGAAAKRSGKKSRKGRKMITNTNTAPLTLEDI